MERIPDAELTPGQVQNIAQRQIDSIRKLLPKDDSPASTALFELAGLVRRLAVIQVSKLDVLQEKLSDLENKINGFQGRQTDDL